MIIKKQVTIELTPEDFLKNLTDEELPLVVATIAEKFSTRTNIKAFSEGLTGESVNFLAAAVSIYYSRR